jgi:hypothetical protein
MLRILIGSLSLIGCLGVSIAAETPAPSTATPVAGMTEQADELFKIASDHCIDKISTPAQIGEGLKGYKTAPPVMTSMFLHDGQGQAWFVPGVHGAYAIAVTQDNSYCKAFAKTAGQNEVLERVAQVVKTPPVGFTARKIGEDSQNVSGGVLRSATYRLERKEGGLPSILIVVETNSAPRAPFKASVKVAPQQPR